MKPLLSRLALCQAYSTGVCVWMDGGWADAGVSEPQPLEWKLQLAGLMSDSRRIVEVPLRVSIA